MLEVLLCVLMNVGIFVCFRMFGVLKLNTFQAIVFNYITCVITGLIFVGDAGFIKQISISQTWVPIALSLGVIFIGTFYLMAITTQKFSITVSSIAAKMSLVIPVLFSLFVLGIKSKDYSIINYLGIFSAVVAILLSSYKEKKIDSEVLKGPDLLLPISIFLLGGIIDSTINYTNHHFLTDKEEAIFPLMIFLSCSVIGFTMIGIKRQKIKIKNILGGVALGIVNYFSIYFLLRALSEFQNDGAIVYPLINVGIIFFGAIISVVYFKERLSRVNLAGLVLAVLAIILISYQELLSTF